MLLSSWPASTVASLKRRQKSWDRLELCKVGAKINVARFMAHRVDISQKGDREKLHK